MTGRNTDQSEHNLVQSILVLETPAYVINPLIAKLWKDAEAAKAIRDREKHETSCYINLIQNHFIIYNLTNDMAICCTMLNVSPYL